MDLLRHWRLYARLARAILLQAACLSLEGVGRRDCNDFLDEWFNVSWLPSIKETPVTLNPPYIPATVADRRHKAIWSISRDAAELGLSRAINHWLIVGRVRFDFLINNGRPTIQLACNSMNGGYQLLGTLGILLMQAVAGTSLPTFCRACGKAFLPARKPAPGRDSYCEEPACKRAAAAAHTLASRA